MIYLDYAANTPVAPQVLEEYVSCEQTYIANPNSAHPLGAAARKKLAEVTDRIGAKLGIDEAGIIYTSGASEANNTAIKGIAAAGRGRHIVSTPLEHPSVSAPLGFLQEQGWEIDYADIGTDGKINVEHLKSLVREDTVLIAVTAVDSELGTIQPIAEIAEIKKQSPGCALHVDATQVVGKIPFSFEGIDTAAFTAHKFYGPNGIGVLYKSHSVSMEPLIHGGGANPYRSGTPAFALVSALGKALSLSLDSLPERYAYVKEMNDHLRARLGKYPAVVINSPADAVPHILNVSVSGVKGTRFRDALAELGVCVSVRSACSTDGAPSKAVYAVSGDRRNALSSWRISLSHLTAEDEINEFLKAFDTCYKRLVG